MLSSVLIDPKEAALVELRPEPLANGVEPEERVIVCGLSWKRYLAFDKKLGDDRSGPRLYYLHGQLEIMTTSHEHERIKKWVADFLADYFLETGIEVIPRGQATMRLALEETGAEPDESWSMGEAKDFPDLVLEISLTSGGINKLEIYRQFKIPEVWSWRRNNLEIFVLGNSGVYEPVRQSRLLPVLDISLLERCIAMASWQQARRAFRAGLSVSR